MARGLCHFSLTAYTIYLNIRAGGIPIGSRFRAKAVTYYSYLSSEGQCNKCGMFAQRVLGKIYHKCLPSQSEALSGSFHNILQANLHNIH